MQDTWNRDELYAKVWSQPVTHVAKEYGVSDVGLAKVCRKLQVPLPGRGYWARTQHGYAVSRKPLPKLKEPIVVTRNVPDIHTSDESPAVPALHPEDQAEFERLDVLAGDGEFAFGVRPRALRHPLIVKTRQALRDGGVDNRNILSLAYRSEALDVRVSKQNVNRSLVFLAAIIAVGQRHGADVVISEGHRGRETSFFVYGQRISFSISEAAHQRKLDQPPQQRPGEYKDAPTIKGKPIEYVPTGKMTFKINRYGAGLRTTWNESTRGLDQLFPEIMATLFKAAVLARREHLKGKAEAEAQRRREKELEKLRHRIEEEEKRVQELEQCSENWHKARRIREYVLAVIDAKKSSGEELGPDTPFGIWTVWALQHADRLDPLVKSPPSILDRKKELPPANRGWCSR